ncbi:FAD-binding and (Fe-S)-binding domain-containing protein [Salinibacterium sp. M195]|uniref:FAD-binding and (Fe-S)-binding domain-containing protein n=1 Tax=Salinibacterium sp. M195 TaxID=2583374 RepID=UPI001C6336FE|nr:FAD-binding and (Fe-S)-binding domain-containing protein [Salinibacterium sp. M195]QYH37025.1 FAD-binding oxidoreductase [Salinibacterium sp. M195]
MQPSVHDQFAAALADAGRLSTRAIDLHANAHDASHFLLIPETLVIAHDAAEVGRLLQVGARTGMPVTLRSGGTSLSGQGLTDGVLIDVRRNFRGITIEDDGMRVRVQPGATVRQVNGTLARHGRKLGPDPASESACTIGGVVANNSSGMACGITGNTYKTLDSLTLVLTSGTVVDTAAPDANQKLRHDEPELFAGLLRLRDRVRANPTSVSTIEHQFSMKNTMGYGLNSFLDHDEPAALLAHLVIGSEGTLGFVAEAVFHTLPLLSHAATGLVIFDSLLAANEALPGIVATGAAAIELMDAQSLRVGKLEADAHPLIRDLAVEKHAALLVEYQAATVEELAEQEGNGNRVLNGLTVSSPAVLSREAATRASLWHLRKGLYATVAGARPSGTTALLEDVVVPVESLARTSSQLSDLFDRYGYQNSVIFGHAKDGNIHFMLTDLFEGAGLERYEAFTEDMVDLVLGEGGSLKAEHGTGRVMAPYVQRQYGDELYGVMREVKALFDPTGMLNPGVIITDDPAVHLKNIKTTPTIEEEVDRCVECGYCEPVCPSSDLTLTPRQRIVVKRAIATALADGDTALAAELEKDYGYEGVQTCAVDGMCQTACPVLINTGDLVRRLRKTEHSAVEKKVWKTAATHWDATTAIAGAALTITEKLPAPIITGPNKVARAVLGDDVLPLWSSELPAGGGRRARPAPDASAAIDAVYVPACVNAMFGPATRADGTRGPGVQASFEELCARAGVTVLVPENIDSLCCGTPWSSKGLPEGAAIMQDRVLASLRTASRDGELPIICDASSCTEGLLHTIENDPAPQARGAQPLRVIDVIEFVADRIVPSLPAGAGTGAEVNGGAATPAYERIDSLALHPTCSSTRLGINEKLTTVANAVAVDVMVPDSWGCCAFAGDRGMLHPELTESATAVQATEVRAAETTTHASCNRTCELGMTRATGSDYRHVVELLAEATR